MNANLQDIGPISFYGQSNVGHDRQQLDATQRPGSVEKSDDGIWDALAAVKTIDCAAELQKRIAEKARNGKSANLFPGDAYLASPILDRYLLDIPGELLLSWVHFNPLRPVVSTLWYAEVTGLNLGLLIFLKIDPFQQQNAVFGLIPGEFNETAIAQAATALFAVNGDESCELFRGLPTSIGHAENWRAGTAAPLFGSKLAKALFRLPAVGYWRTTDMQVFCDHLRRFPDPWERATAAIEYWGIVAGAKTIGVNGFSESGFDDWFDLVTDPVHVDSERRQVGAAREGALRLSERQQFAGAGRSF